MRALIALVLAGCAAAPRPVATPRRLGDAMDEAGRRFHRAGRAGLAGRWELAKYDLHELTEIFEEDLAGSTWHGKPQVPELARRFQSEQLPSLEAAITRRDAAAFQTAVAETARACNQCHKVAAQDFIEISEIPGAETPVVERK